MSMLSQYHKNQLYQAEVTTIPKLALADSTIQISKNSYFPSQQQQQQLIRLALIALSLPGRAMVY